MSDDLNKRIAEAQQKLDAQKRPAGRPDGKGWSLGFRMASDFVAATIVGAILGWGIDALFGTAPWGLIVCLFLGFIAGIRMIMRAANEKAVEAAGENKDEDA